MGSVSIIKWVVEEGVGGGGGGEYPEKTPGDELQKLPLQSRAGL